MTRHLLFAFVILFLSAAASAQTNVSGNITQNTTWTKAGSPYILTGNVGVPSAYTLTIEPGVEVQRTLGAYEILVNGILRSAGTEQDSIVFTSSGVVLPPVAFVVFKRSNLDNSTMRFLSFRSVNSTYSNSFQIGDEDPNMQNGPKNTGTLHVSRCHINGDILTRDYQSVSGLVIDSCNVTSSHINSSSYIGFGNIMVLNSRISNSLVENTFDVAGYIIRNCQCDSTVIRLEAAFITENLIDSSSFVSCNVGTNAPTQITNSTFLNSRVLGQGAVSIVGSKFTATDRLYNPNILFFSSPDETMVEADGIYLSGCEFTNEAGYNASGVYINGFSRGDNTIRFSRFNNLYNGVTVQNFNTMDVDSNDFYSPARYDIENLGQKDFNAVYNYYQLTGNETIDNLIFDANDDLNYGYVYYQPAAGSPNTGTLPVALVRFTGSKEGSAVKLNWQTGSEVNVAAFTIQRKTGNGFIDIGTVAASSISSSYSFTDASPLSGTNEYRLKITEKDGKYAYSSIVPVDYNSLVKALRVYPNPASTYIVVEYAAASAGTQLQLTDAGGRVIKTMVAASGSTQTRMSVGGVARGTYKLVMKDGSKTESRTVLIQ